MKTETVSLLETRLAIGECVANAQSELVLVRSLVPFEITEANAENITVRKSKGGLRPLTDTADTKDKGTAADYRAAVHSFAVNVANKHVRWTPKIGQEGSLSPNPKENDPHVQETPSA